MKSLHYYTRSELEALLVRKDISAEFRQRIEGALRIGTPAAYRACGKRGGLAAKPTAPVLCLWGKVPNGPWQLVDETELTPEALAVFTRYARLAADVRRPNSQGKAPNQISVVVPGELDLPRTASSRNISRSPL